jgi:hypothetical protein
MSHMTEDRVTRDQAVDAAKHVLSRRLRRYQAARAELPEVVTWARALGVPWGDIARDVGMSRQGVDSMLRRAVRDAACPERARRYRE